MNVLLLLLFDVVVDVVACIDIDGTLFILHIIIGWYNDNIINR